MADVGMLNNHNIKLIAERSGIAEKQIRYIIENEGYQVYKDTHEQLNSTLIIISHERPCSYSTKLSMMSITLLMRPCQKRASDL